MPASEDFRAGMDEMLALARDPAPASRARLASAMSELVVSGPGRRWSLNERERTLAANILVDLLRDVEVAVRRGLAERIAREPSLPAALAKHLANDEIEVARPILVESGALDDEALVEVVVHRTLQHRLAISLRKQVSPQVSAALVDKGEIEVTESLLANIGARFTTETFAKVMDAAREHAPLRAPLLRREDLDPEIAGRMYGWVSMALRRHIVQNFPVDAAILDRHLRETLEEVVADHARMAAIKEVAPQLAHAVKTRERVAPDTLVALLRRGEVAVFELVFARFADLPVALVRRILYGKSRQALAVVAKATGLEREVFAAVFALTRNADGPSRPTESSTIRAALLHFDRLDRDGATRQLESWRKALAEAAGGGARGKIREFPQRWEGLSRRPGGGADT